MAAPLKPALRTSFGRDSWGIALAIADVAAPTLAELNAASGLNISCSVFGDQEFVTATTEKVTLPRLACETTQYEFNGSTTHALADLVLSIQPQAADGSDGKKAWEVLDDYMHAFLWNRPDMLPTEDLAAGQFVNIVPIQLATKTPGRSSTGADGVYNFTVGASITSAPQWLVPIGA